MDDNLIPVWFGGNYPCNVFLEKYFCDGGIMGGKRLDFVYALVS